MFDWTEERIETALRLQRENHSTKEIARHLGTTKNAVIGKLHRVKIARGEKPKRKSDTTRNERRKRRNKMLTLATRAESVSRYVSAPIPKPDEGMLASIVDVTGCRFPVREDASFVGGQAFCNHEQDGNSPYCPYHHKMTSYKAPSKPEGIKPFGLLWGKRAA